MTFPFLEAVLGCLISHTLRHLSHSTSSSLYDNSFHVLVTSCRTTFQNLRHIASHKVKWGIEAVIRFFKNHFLLQYQSYSASLHSICVAMCRLDINVTLVYMLLSKVQNQKYSNRKGSPPPSYFIASVTFPLSELT